MKLEGDEGVGDATAARELVQSAMEVPVGAFGDAVMTKARHCLLDYLSCAFEALPLPWSKQAAALATPVANGSHLVGRAASCAPGDAAFANAVAGHGLVREDMHAGSVAHLGVVVWPTVLALAERFPLSGAQALAAGIVGYETGARIGRAIVLFFSPGARTFWHKHDAGQVLQVTAGSGWICVEGAEPQLIRQGDVVWIGPGERHWHGADANSYLVHLAISLGKADWQEEVSEADYARTRTGRVPAGLNPGGTR